MIPPCGRIGDVSDPDPVVALTKWNFAAVAQFGYKPV
jgi:hypothetical protein